MRSPAMPSLPSRRERRLARRRHRNTGRERPPERTWGHVSGSRGGSLTPQMLFTDIWRGGINRRHSTSGTEHDAAHTSSGYGTSCRESMQLAGGMSLMPRGLRRARSQGGLSSPSAVSSPLSPPCNGSRHVRADQGRRRRGRQFDPELLSPPLSPSAVPFRPPLTSRPGLKRLLELGCCGCGQDRSAQADGTVG